MNAHVPDLEWYIGVSERKGLLPRCPFASVNRCPRYYESLSLLRLVGTTAIDPVENDRLFRAWSESDLWPTIGEQATSISGGERGEGHLPTSVRRLPLIDLASSVLRVMELREDEGPP